MSNKGYNRAILAGNLGADAELRRSQSGNAILSLRLGCTTTFYDKEKGEQERTAWVSVKIFGKRAEALAPYLTKGTGLLVEGHIETGSYDAADGTKRYTVDVIADDIILQGGGKRSDSAPTDAGEPQQRALQGNGSRPQYNRQATPQQRQAPRSGGNGAGSARAPADPQEPAESDGGGFGGDDDIPF